LLCTRVSDDEDNDDAASISCGGVIEPVSPPLLLFDSGERIRRRFACGSFVDVVVDVDDGSGGGVTSS
jgi:hypothetical protein